MSVTYCVVKGCSSKLGGGLSFFRCPLDETRCQVWKNVLGFTGSHKYANITLEQSHTRIKVCGLHFTENCFANEAGNRLLKFAIPSLRLDSSSVFEEVSKNQDSSKTDACTQTESETINVRCHSEPPNQTDDDMTTSRWTDQGVSDLQHLHERAARHENAAVHMNRLLDFYVLGSVDIRTQLDSAYPKTLRGNIEKLEEIKHALRRLITRFKFSEAFVRALYESNSLNQKTVDFSSELDTAILQEFSQAKEYERNLIKNELLDAMLEICKNEIKNQIKESNFLAMEVAEIAEQQKLVIIFRYVYDGQVLEQFWGFLRLEDFTVENISQALLQELDGLEIDPKKLIAQCYIGTFVICSQIEEVIRKKYPYAYFFRSYTHPRQCNFVLDKPDIRNEELNIFFEKVEAFQRFFSRTPKYNEALDKKFLVQWDLIPKTMNVLYEKRRVILDCLQEIPRCTNVEETVSEANSLFSILDSSDFIFGLEALYHITNHVGFALKKTGTPGKDLMPDFESNISAMIRSTIRGTEAPKADKVITEHCNKLIELLKDVFYFTEDLLPAALLCPSMFEIYKNKFPQVILSEMIKNYPFFNAAKLKLELQIIYNRQDIRCNRDDDGLLPMLTFIHNSDSHEGLSEIYKLLNIISTTPMTARESETSFRAFKKVKCFLGNTVRGEKLDALAMLSIEKKLIHSIFGFDHKVINIIIKNKDGILSMCKESSFPFKGSSIESKYILRRPADGSILQYELVGTNWNIRALSQRSWSNYQNYVFYEICYICENVLKTEMYF